MQDGQRRPLIGVTGPDKHGAVAWYCTRLAVWRAGGRACRITPARAPSKAPLDGLIVGGGADVSPRLYGEEPASLRHVWGHMKRVRRGPLERWSRLVLLPVIYLVRLAFSRGKPCAPWDQRRDQLEYALLEHACDQRLPVLGICRGAQMLNVQRGGTLHQELSDFYIDQPRIYSVFPEKCIHVVAGSRLAGILGVTECRVNGLHNQAVFRLGSGLDVVAREENQIIQGIEDRSMPYVLGVQWHPEYLQQIPAQSRIFSALVDEARRHAHSRCSRRQ